MVEAPTFFRIFLNFKDLKNPEHSIIIVEEKSEQLSSGTTGLSSWQAAFVLANFIKNQEFFKNKKILELGAGCGLTGIACAKYCSPESLYLTDFNPDVLAQLQKNIDLNGLSNTVVRKLDWMNFEMNQLEVRPDVVIAAGMMFLKFAI